ncbi:MAG: hypothetical protein ACI95X_000587, partial [Paraglaciecola sp.]
MWLFLSGFIPALSSLHFHPECGYSSAVSSLQFHPCTFILN